MNITPFSFNGAEVRTITRDGEPWFVAVDVASLLGYSNPHKAMRDHCKGVNESFIPSAGGEQSFKQTRFTSRGLEWVRRYIRVAELIGTPESIAA